MLSPACVRGRSSSAGRWHSSRPMSLAAGCDSTPLTRHDVHGQTRGGRMNNERLVETFVELADTLIDDFDVIDFLHVLVDRSVELLDIDAAGLLLANQRGE